MALLGMPRRLIHALFVCVALAVVLLAPLRARAAILPACENRELLTPAPAPVPASTLLADLGHRDPAVDHRLQLTVLLPLLDLAIEQLAER